MKKVLVALDNQLIVEKIKKTGKYIVHDKDVSFQKGVLQYVADNDVDIVITKDTLSGEMTKEIYLKQIKLIKPNCKIILFVEELTDEYKGFLFANDIFNIMETTTVSFMEIMEMIESTQKQVIYKTSKEPNKQSLCKLNVTTKKFISVYGTSGAGKSYVSSLLSIIFSKKFKFKTLLVDMDIQNAAIDIYNNINTNGASLCNVMEEMDNSAFTANILSENIIESRGNKRLNFLINNMGIYESQNKIAPVHYSRLYKEAKNRYDITLVDLPSAPFLDVVPYSLVRSDIIFFVINPNFISIRQAVKYLELITNVWNINKEKIVLVVNKQRKDSLGIRQIETMLREFKVCLRIVDSNNIEKIINGLDNIENVEVKEISALKELLGLDSKGVDIYKENLDTKIEQLVGVHK